jgi:hypothetical protein
MDDRKGIGVGDHFGAIASRAIDLGFDRVQLERAHDGQPAAVRCGYHDVHEAEIVLPFDEHRFGLVGVEARTRAVAEICAELGALKAPPTADGQWLEGDGIESLAALYVAVYAAAKRAEGLKAQLLERMRVEGRTAVEVDAGAVVLKPGSTRTMLDSAATVVRLAELAEALTLLGRPTPGEAPKKTVPLAPYLEVVFKP